MSTVHTRLRGTFKVLPSLSMSRFRYAAIVEDTNYPLRHLVIPTPVNSNDRNSKDNNKK